jgi:hypothetical protein
MVYNIVWGTELGALVDYLNNTMRNEGVENIYFQIEKNERRKILTKNFIILNLNSF